MIYLIISALIHFALLFSLKSSPDVTDSPIEGREGPAQGTEPGFQIVSVGKGAGLPCGDGYGGIGILLHDGRRVGTVYPGYPAARAGIVEGDMLSLNQSEIRGPVGSTVNVTVERQGKTLKFSMVRQFICVGG